MPKFDPGATGAAGETLPPFFTLPRHSFLGVEFRALTTQIRGAMREVVHEYERLPGGEEELLARRLYEFNYTALFVTNDPEIPNSWPGNSTLLRQAFEQGIKGDLVVSTIGTVRAYAVSWEIEQTNRVFNGEQVKIQFREASMNDVLTPDAVIALNVQPLPQRVAGAISIWKSTPPRPELVGTPKLLAREQRIGSFFDAIFDLAGQIQGLIVLSKLQLDVIAARATALADMVRSFCELEEALRDPRNWRLLRALHTLAVAADAIAQSAFAKAAPIVSYRTPAEMSVTDVSIAVYGDTSRTMDVMRLNALRDPFHIPQGTNLRVFAKTSPIGLLRAA